MNAGKGIPPPSDRVNFSIDKCTLMHSLAGRVYLDADQRRQRTDRGLDSMICARSARTQHRADDTRDVTLTPSPGGIHAVHWS